MAVKCSKCGCSEVRRSARRTWERLFLGILLPYRCVGCNHRFLALPGDNRPEGAAKRRPMAKAAAASGESKVKRGK